MLKIKNCLHWISSWPETAEGGRGATPTPPPSLASEDELEAGLIELLQSENWAGALSLVKQNRRTWSNDFASGEDDISTAIAIYSRKIMLEKTGKGFTI